MPQHPIQMTVKQAEKNFGIEIIGAEKGLPLDPLLPDHPPPPKHGVRRKVRLADKTSFKPRPEGG